MVFMIYFFSMVVYPYVGHDFKYLHDVWYSWQTFNAAMIALLASVIALIAAFYQDKKQQDRNVKAARALLPEVANQMMLSSFRGASLLKEAYEKRHDVSPSFYLVGNISDASEWAMNIIKECIVYADESEIEFLVGVVGDWQKLKARFISMSADFNVKSEDGVIVLDEASIVFLVDELVFFVAKLHKIFYCYRDGKDVELNEVTNYELLCAFDEMMFDRYIFIDSFNKISTWGHEKNMI